MYSEDKEGQPQSALSRLKPGSRDFKRAVQVSELLTNILLTKQNQKEKSKSLTVSDMIDMTLNIEEQLRKRLRKLFGSTKTLFEARKHARQAGMELKQWIGRF